MNAPFAHRHHPFPRVAREAGVSRGSLVALLIAAFVSASGCTFIAYPGSTIRGCARDGGDRQFVAEPEAVSIVALGDFGSADEGRGAAVGAALKAFLGAQSLTPAAAVLLGDNFYNAGLIGGTRCPWWGSAGDPAAITQQLDAVIAPFEFLRQQTTTYVVPGNHDHGCPRLKSLENEADIDQWLPPARAWGDRWQFRSGLPTEAIVGDLVQIVFIDSEQMIEDGDVLNASLDRLRELLAHGSYRWRLVAGHHPLYTNGPHDGAGWTGAMLKALYYPLHLLVFPPFVYGNEGAYEWRYRRYRDRLEQLFAERRIDVFLAGHEHALELLAANGAGQPLTVVSGSAAKCSPLMRRSNTIFSASQNGFALLTATRQRLEVEFVGTTACDDGKVCPQPAQLGAWHRLFGYGLPPAASPISAPSN
ncbi:MAG: metallophosphoesterase [Deltaproteobacteria bacterium]|nr:metallophosphoesterase [Deltaproteobacteria bacterium]MBI3389132.1 metallophosphoesterase [Deltaproteobacteria bacterium]